MNAKGLKEGLIAAVKSAGFYVIGYFALKGGRLYLLEHYELAVPDKAFSLATMVLLAATFAYAGNHWRNTKANADKPSRVSRAQNEP